MATYQQNPIADAYCSSANGNSNYGDREYLWIGQGSTGDIDAIFIKFDLSSIPSYSIINSATLRFYQYDGSNDWLSPTISIIARPIGQSWSESSVTWNNQPAGVAEDSPATSFANNIATSVDINVAAPLQYMVANQSTTYGFHVIYTGSSNSTRKEFRSRNYSNSAYRPVLIVDYTANIAPYWGSADFTAPTGTVIATPATGGYNFTWGDATDPNGDTLTYYVSRAINNVWTIDVQVSTAKSFYQTFSGYNRGDYFQLRVAARDPYGSWCSDKTFIYSALVGINILPTAPTSVSINYTNRVISTLSAVTVSWSGGGSGNAEQTAYYDVYRYVNGSPTKIVSFTTDTSYGDTGFGAATNPNDSVYYTVQTYDGQEYSSGVGTSNTIVVNSFPGQPGTISPAATTNQATTITNSISLSWTESTDAQGDAVSYHVQYRTASTSAGLTGAWTTLTTSRIAAGPYVHDVTGITEGYFFQYNIIPYDDYEEGTARVSPIYQRNVKPSAVTGVTRVSSSVVTAANAIDINWDTSTTHTLPSSGISITNSVTNIQYATSTNGSTWGSWQTLNSPAITDGVDETFSSAVYVTTFGLSRGHYVKFQFQVQDALGFTSTWVESLTTRYNSLPNAVTSIYPTSTGVTIYPNAVAYTNTSFAVIGGGDADGQQTYFNIDIGINANGTQTQTWTNIASWVAAGSPNFDYTAVSDLENLALNYSATNCQIRVKVRDTLNEETGYYYSAVFTVDYRDAPSNVSAPSITPSALAGGKTARVNPAATLTLTWSAPTDRNTGETFTYQVFISTDGGADTQIPGNQTSGYVYTVPANTGNDKTIKFKIRATDSAGLTSNISTSTYSSTYTVCRLVTPNITLVSAARSGALNKNLTVSLYSSDTGGSRPISGTNDTDFFTDWDNKNNFYNTPFTYGIQYANNPSFSGAISHSAIDYSELMFTDPVGIGKDYTVSATAANVPPFIYSTLAWNASTPKSYTTVGEILSPTSSYYIRAYITINGTTTYSSAIYVKEIFPTMSFKKYQIGINTGTPHLSTTHAALTIYGFPTMVSGDTILDVGAAGAVNEAYVGFRANAAEPNTISGKLGCGTDGILKWNTTSLSLSTHTHGNITAAGAIGSTVGLMIITTAAGVLTTLAAGTTSQYLRGDGTWQTVTVPSGLTAGSASSGYLQYAGTTAVAGQLDGGTTTPTGTFRLNYGGHFYPTALNLVGQADTATVATHYFVETATDGYIRPKTLADVKTEIVTKAAVEAVLTGAITTHTHSYLQLSGGTLTGGISTNSQITSTLAIGTAPFVITSTTICTNLNADKLDGYEASNAADSIPISNGTLNINFNADMLEGYHATDAATGNTIVLRNSSGHIYSTQINCSRSDESSTAASYIYDSGDGWLRKKTLANAKTELVTRASVKAGIITGSGSGTYNPAELAAQEALSLGPITCTGARLGDYAIVSCSIDVGELTVSAYVNATDQVTVRLFNGKTSTAVNIGSGTWRVMSIAYD